MIFIGSLFRSVFRSGLKIGIFLLSVCLSIVSLSQAKTNFSGSFTDISTTELLQTVEDQTSAKFYFNHEWIDSLSFSGSFDNESLDQVLSTVFRSSNINFFIRGNEIFLTRESPIIGQPEILKSIRTIKKSEETNVPKGLVFSREYMGASEDAEDFENFVFEIGSRKNFKPNSRSILAGYVREKETGEPIVGAIVYTDQFGTATDTDYSGFYSLSLPTGKHELLIQYTGMRATKRNVVLYSDGRLDVNMDVEIIALEAVTVESERDANVLNVQMGVSRIDVSETKNVPIVMGEKDIMKVATTLAGVQTVGEGAAGLNVRGGKSDQNMILINDATVYNSSHFLGFFSAFNSDALQNMEIYKSSIPASRGGRLSSIFDIETLKANQEKFVGVGGISPITSKLTLEIPIIKNRSGLMVSGRTTYSNWVLKRTDNVNFKENRVWFADFIMRYDHKIDEKNDLVVSAYASKDDFRLNSDTLFSFSNFSFQNANASIKWKHTFSESLLSQFTAFYSSYGYNVQNVQSEPNAFAQDFGLEEIGVKSNFDYYFSEDHGLSFGTESKLTQVDPGNKTPLGAKSEIKEVHLDSERAMENSIFLSDQYNFSDKFSASAGVRYTLYTLMGPELTYKYNNGSPKNGDSRTDSVFTKNGQIAQVYPSFEPRLSARYSIDKATSVKVSYGRTRQFIHTLSNSASLSPTDIWRVSNEHLKPQIADQYSIGLFRNFLHAKLETSVEAYYKRLQNLIDFKVGADFLLVNDVETVTLQGPGKSYGVEFSLKKTGKLSGWLNYTYSRSFIKLNGNFPEEIINEGVYYRTNYDKPHTFNLVANWKLTHRISFSYNFTYNSGRPVTYPVASYQFKGSQIIHYSDRNAFRIPDYMRMDFGVSLEAGHKIQKLAHSYWSFSIYNMLGRDNPYSVFFDVKNGAVSGHKLVVFGNAIPTISYNFRF